jgi:hypothetical protein
MSYDQISMFGAAFCESFYIALVTVDRKMIPAVKPFLESQKRTATEQLKSWHSFPEEQ